MHLQPNTLLQGGKYKIVRFINAGGFGNTYEGELVLIHRRVAIKEFFVKDCCNRDGDTSHVSVSTQSKADLVERLKRKFMEEAASIWQFNHPNIVRVTDVFEENGTAYYVMDYVEGMSLQDMLKRNGAMSEAKALQYIRQVGEALKYVHAQNRLHLDIKPGNIMVDASGKAILIDFGASKQYDEDGENTSTLLGLNTVGYAPVEQMSRNFSDFNPAADVYALGATLYKLLTNITPPDAIMLMSGDEELVPMPFHISNATRTAIEKAMIPQRNRRLQSIEEFVTLLTAAPDAEEKTLVDVKDEQAETERRRKEAEAKAARERAEERRREEARKREEAARKAAEEAKRKAEEERKKKSNRIGTIICNLLLWSIVGGACWWYYKHQVKYDTSNQTIVFGTNSYPLIRVDGGTYKRGYSNEDNPSYFNPIYDSFGWEDALINKAINEEAYGLEHNVTLDGFYIGQTEVTQELWESIMGYNPSHNVGKNLPVENVSWNDCQRFISKLNENTGCHFRLPTEMEWEFAACGGTRSKGYKYSGSDDLSDIAWDSAYNMTHNVAMKRPNELGIFDMSGNVWEFCQDWASKDSYMIKGAVKNPQGPRRGTAKVLKGGGIVAVDKEIQSGLDYCEPKVNGLTTMTPDSCSYEVGFRLVLPM